MGLDRAGVTFASLMTLGPDLAVTTARLAEDLGYTSFWTAETTGPEAFSLLAAAGSEAPGLDLGTGVLALQHEFSDNISAYISASRGYKGGGANPRPFNVAQAVAHNPETLEAYEAGFNDQSYFTKSFKKHFGVAPSEYAKSVSI